MLPQQENAQTKFRTAQNPDYPYQNVRMPYRTEKIIISPQEKELLHQWRTNRLPILRSPLNQCKIIIDTDIGTDIDDALSLLMLLHLPAKDYQLLGITTTYGYSHLRAAIANKIVRAFGKQNSLKALCPVIAGESTPLGTHRPVWHTGTEGKGILKDREIEQLQKQADFIVANNIPVVLANTKDEAQKKSRHQAALWIIEQVKKFPYEVTIVGLGALSNIAMALRLDKTIAPLIPRIVFTGVGSDLRQHHQPGDRMEYGSDVWFRYPTHNISCDTLAAIEVFESNIPIDVVCNTLTTKLWWGQSLSDASFDRETEAMIEESTIACLSLVKAKSPKESVIVGKMLKEWLCHRSAIFLRIIQGTCPHDCLTVAETVYPGRFMNFTEPGHMMIHEWAGFPTFINKTNGPHRLGANVKINNFIGFLNQCLKPDKTSYKGEKNIF